MVVEQNLSSYAFVQIVLPCSSELRTSLNIVRLDSHGFMPEPSGKKFLTQTSVGCGGSAALDIMPVDSRLNAKIDRRQSFCIVKFLKPVMVCLSFVLIA